MNTVHEFKINAKFSVLAFLIKSLQENRNQLEKTIEGKFLINLIEKSDTYNKLNIGTRRSKMIQNNQMILARLIKNKNYHKKSAWKIPIISDSDTGVAVL